EHFIPLPKLIILGQLQLTGWDFRAGTVFNAALLGVLAAAMIEAARRLRGRMNYTDAFFPLALLNFGNHFNLFIGWQLQFIGSVVLASVLLLIIVRNRERLTTGTVALAGVCLMLLPLFGANGVVLVPALALWAGYAAVHQWRSPSGARVACCVLLASTGVALLLVGLFFGKLQKAEIRPGSSIRDSF